MRSSTGLKLFKNAMNLTEIYHNVNIIDEWNKGEDINETTVAEGVTDESTWDAENDFVEVALPTFRENEMKLYPGIAEYMAFNNKQDWLNNGSLTQNLLRGNRVNCAAMMGTLITNVASDLSCKAKVEIIATGEMWANATLCFVVVNRQGSLQSLSEWGEDAFIVDIWLRNQLPKIYHQGAIWVNDLQHSKHFVNVKNEKSLCIMSTLMDNLDITESTESKGSESKEDLARTEKVEPVL